MPWPAVARVQPGMTVGRWLLYKLAVGAIDGLSLPALAAAGRWAHLNVGFIGLLPAWVWVLLGIVGYLGPERWVDVQLERRKQLRAGLPALPPRSSASSGNWRRTPPPSPAPAPTVAPAAAPTSAPTGAPVAVSQTGQVQR